MSRTSNEPKKITIGELLENDDTDLKGVSDGSSNDITSLRASLFEIDSEEETELKATKRIAEETSKMQVFLLRNSEPMNSISDQWMPRSFVDGKYVRYDLNQPSQLPHRNSTIAFKNDPLLTVIGLRMCGIIGEAFVCKGIEFDFAHSNPSLRCIQTAHRLISVQRNRAPLRIEQCSIASAIFIDLVFHNLCGKTSWPPAEL